MSKIITPAITALAKDGLIDYAGNEAIIDHLVKGGVDGILVLGSTGEFTTMSYEEKWDLLSFYAVYVRTHAALLEKQFRLPTELYAGVNCPDIHDTIRLANEAHAIGYNGVLDVGPYYFGMDEETIFAYYDRMLQEVAGPFYIYNFPDRTGHSIAPETVRRLHEKHTNLWGMKDSVQNPGHTRDVCFAVADPGFEMYSGFDDQYLLNIAAGGWGCISALSNIVPEIWSALVFSHDVGGENVMRLYSMITRLMQLYAIGPNFTQVFKRLLKDMGILRSDYTVFPTTRIDPARYREGRVLLQETMLEFENLTPD